MPEMTPFERRAKARKIRGLITVGDKPKSMTEAANIQGVSRTWAYKILEELHEWEKTKTFEEEIADIDMQLRKRLAGNKEPKTWDTCDSSKWYLTSGKLTYAYAVGDYQDIRQTPSPILDHINGRLQEPTEAGQAILDQIQGIDPLCD